MPGPGKSQAGPEAHAACAGVYGWAGPRDPRQSCRASVLAQNVRVGSMCTLAIRCGLHLARNSASHLFTATRLVTLSAKNKTAACFLIMRYFPICRSVRRQWPNRGAQYAPHGPVRQVPPPTALELSRPSRSQRVFWISRRVCFIRIEYDGDVRKRTGFGESDRLTSPQIRWLHQRGNRDRVNPDSFTTYQFDQRVNHDAGVVPYLRNVLVS